MIRLNLKPSLIKNLSFNRTNETLEIEFKRHIKTAECINIPLSILQEYVESLKLEDTKEEQSNLKLVHSNFKSSKFVLS